MKFLVNENFEFYSHFDFGRDYTLISDYANLIPLDNFFHISWDWRLDFVLKSESLEYLKSLSEE